MRLSRYGPGTVVVLLALLVVLPTLIIPTLNAVASFIAVIAPYVAWAVVLFLVVVVVLRFLNR